LATRGKSGLTKGQTFFAQYNTCQSNRCKANVTILLEIVYRLQLRFHQEN